MKISAADLRTFAAIAELGGISAAARKLGMQKSSVSRDLAALEDRLGARLVQRTTRQVSLTEAGEVLAAYAFRVVEELENAEAAVDALLDTPRGHLAVTAPYAFVRFILAPQLAKFQALYPDLQLSINPSIQTLDLIEEGIDVAIRVGSLTPSTMIARKLGETPLLLAASKNYARTHDLPLSLDDLATHRLIDLRPRAAPNEWTLIGAGGRTETVSIRPKLALNEPSILHDFVEQGLGIGLLPAIYAAPAIAAGRLIRVLPDYQGAARPIHAIYPSRRLLTPKVRAFIDFVEDSFPAAN